RDRETLRLVSYKPGPAPKGDERAAISYPQDPSPVVKSRETLASAPAAAPDLGEFFQLAALESAQPLMPAGAAGIAPAGSVIQTSASPNSPASQNLVQPAGQEQTQPYVSRLETLSRQVEGISQNVAGFRFSGDLRLRGDGVFRSSDKTAGPEQNVRGQYRARLNLDKGIDKQLNVHFQLG